MPSVLIIGGGPAGLSAAIYATRANIQTTVVYKDGGALEKTDKIENYFGFTDALSGPDLLARGRAQATRLGAQLIQAEVTGVEYAEKGFTVKTTAGAFPADAVILATGAPRATPPIPGVRELEGRGVSYCAVCDAFFYRGKAVAVLGEGEYALEGCDFCDAADERRAHAGPSARRTACGRASSHRNRRRGKSSACCLSDRRTAGCRRCIYRLRHSWQR